MGKPRKRYGSHRRRRGTEAERLTVRLAVEIAAAVRAVADAEGRSLSDCAEEAFGAWLRDTPRRRRIDDEARAAAAALVRRQQGGAEVSLELPPMPKTLREEAEERDRAREAWENEQAAKQESFVGFPFDLFVRDNE